MGFAQYENFSIVVQGPPAGVEGRQTRELIKAIKAHFPSIEVVFSTWAGMGRLVVDLDCQVIESRDPGGVKIGGTLNNVDRQILSSLAGLRASARPLAVKIRSDLRIAKPAQFSGFLKKVMEGVGGLQKDDELPQRTAIQAQQTHSPMGPIYVTDTTTINPARMPPNSPRRFLAICDWIYAGHKSDLEVLLSAPSYNKFFERKAADLSSEERQLLLPNAEQWITTQYVSRYYTPLNKVELFREDEQEILREAHISMIPILFDLIPLKETGLSSTKYPPFYFSRELMYSKREWNVFKGSGLSCVNPISQCWIYLSHILPRAIIRRFPSGYRAKIRSIAADHVWRTSN